MVHTVRYGVAMLISLLDQIAFGTTALALLVSLAVVAWAVLSVLPTVLSLTGL